MKKEVRKKERDKRVYCLFFEFVIFSEDEVVNSDYEIVKSDISMFNNKLINDYLDFFSENFVRMLVFKIKVSFRLVAILFLKLLDRI